MLFLFLTTLYSVCLKVVSGESDYVSITPDNLLGSLEQLSVWGNSSRIVAEYLVEQTKPRCIVDLGIDYGFSTLVFSKSLNSSNSNGRVIAIDSFHYEYSPGQYRDVQYFVKGVLEQSELGNVELVKASFEEASKEWIYGRSIDILHFDGGHKYEEVKAEYELFADKVKKDGIVLFHNVYVYDTDYGVYKFFDELTDYQYKGYFKNDLGLGIATNNFNVYVGLLKHFPEFTVGAPMFFEDYSVYHLPRSTIVPELNVFLDINYFTSKLLQSEQTYSDTNHISVFFRRPEEVTISEAYLDLRSNWVDSINMLLWQLHDLRTEVELLWVMSTIRQGLQDIASLACDVMLSMQIPSPHCDLDAVFAMKTLDWMSTIAPDCTIQNIFRLLSHDADTQAQEAAIRCSSMGSNLQKLLLKEKNLYQSREVFKRAENEGWTYVR